MPGFWVVQVLLVNAVGEAQNEREVGVLHVDCLTAQTGWEAQSRPTVVLLFMMLESL